MNFPHALARGSLSTSWIGRSSTTTTSPPPWRASRRPTRRRAFRARRSGRRSRRPTPFSRPAFPARRRAWRRITIRCSSSIRPPAAKTSPTRSRPTTFDAQRLNLWKLGLTASYTIDFWGVNDDASKAARILANASRFDRNVVEISTIASVLNTYFTVLNAQDLLRIAHEQRPHRHRGAERHQVPARGGDGDRVRRRAAGNCRRHAARQHSGARTDAAPAAQSPRRAPGTDAGEPPHGGLFAQDAAFPECPAGAALRGSAAPSRRRGGRSEARFSGIFGAASAGRLLPDLHFDGA